MKTRANDRKRKKDGVDSNTTAKVTRKKKKATATTTAIATKKKREPVASTSSTESTSVSDHSSITSPTKTSTEGGSNGRKNTPSPSALDDRSNIMGRDDIMGRDASGKSSRRSTPTTKKKH